MDLPQKYRNATPGPWHRNIKPAKRYVTVWAGRNTHIAKLSSEHMTEEEAEANIQLMADAPMLACRVNELEQLVSDLWWFTENVSDVAPDRHDRFFALRERVRESLAANDNAPCGDDQTAGNGEALAHG